ncbi:MAG TPA: N-acyl homoserine lactonase family protein [Candidatus Sulfotelmatobacter sp.]|nr:N-acyl homoserine lactonase family protein [Candidatus Sulfotelmatobacter sp.]
MRTLSLVLSLAAASLLAAPAFAAPATVQRLYVMNCGEIYGKDQARWSPGVNVGQPIELSDNCYLIEHGKQLLLWDTGVPDAVTKLPNGVEAAGGAIVLKRSRTLVSELAQVKVTPDAITYVALSHNHGDHTGNAKLFPHATFLVQKAEYDFAYADPAKSPLPADAKVVKLDGDDDVFGDGSVMILSTPGHTPGHQSLLVYLRKTGPVVLTGDAAHFKDNFVNRRVPGFNSDAAQTVASMDRLDRLAKDLHAQLWINHDKPTSDAQRHAPKFYD